MDVKGIFDHIVQATNMDPIAVTVWLILTTLFIWLNKEFKEQYRISQDKTTKINDSSLLHYSKILKSYYTNKHSNNNTAEFFSFVYESLPYMDVALMQEVLKDLEDICMSEEEKLNTIGKKVLNEVKNIKEENKKWKHLKLPYDLVFYVKNKLKPIFYPIIMSITTVYIGTYFMLILFNSDDTDLNALKLSAIIIMFFLIIGILELMLTNKLKWISIPIIIINIGSIITLLLQTSIEWVSLTFIFLVFLLSLVFLFTLGTKVKKVKKKKFFYS
ncbi:hypothetical protein ACWE42_15495 [Sutcliffiella cohnii]